MNQWKWLLASLLMGCMGTDPDLKTSQAKERASQSEPGVLEGYYPVNGKYVKVKYEMRDNRPMLGGDIALDAEKISSEIPSNSHLSKTGAVSNNNFWPSRYIAYYIDPGVSTSSEQAVVDAMYEYSSKTNMVFSRNWTEPTTGAYIKFIHASYSYSAWVGYEGSGAHIVGLGANGVGVKHTIHEIGHRIGLWHEHQRPDRDLYLNLYYENWCGHDDRLLIDSRAISKPGYCPSWGTNMDIVPNSFAYGGPLDFNSIMMYWHASWGLQDSSGNPLGQPAANSIYAGPNFAAHARREGFAYPTMLRKGYDYATDNTSWNWLGLDNAELSPQDVSTINSMYPLTPAAVGWIDMGNGNCGSGAGGFIQQDDEDVGNGTQAMTWNSGSPPGSHNYNDTKGIYRVTVSGHHEFTRINWCKEQIVALPVLRADYAVLKMSDDCPLNGFSFSRTADNENNNGNSSQGTIYPSSTTTGSPYSGSTTLHFCFVPGDRDFNSAAAPSPPWLSREAGAFTRGDFSDFSGTCDYHWHIQDDEDVGNAFSSGGNYVFSAAAAPFENRIKDIFGYSTTESHYFWHECAN